eukprot:5569824-Pleurochrysis_carterae.AAC.1
MSRGSFLDLLGGEASGKLTTGVGVGGTTDNDGNPAASPSLRSDAGGEGGKDGGTGGGDDDDGSGVDPVQLHSDAGGEGGAEEYAA